MSPYENWFTPGIPVCVRVLHNADSGFWWPYEPGHELRLAIEFDHTPEGGSVGQFLDRVYRQLNVDEPQDWWAKRYRELRNRSLSVGDVVALRVSDYPKQRAWTVDRIGWKEVWLT